MVTTPLYNTHLTELLLIYSHTLFKPPPDTYTTMADVEENKVIKTLEEDDEFEDFPEDSNWSSDSNPLLNSAHLWEEDWDDDDVKDEFSEKLREELKKAQK